MEFIITENKHCALIEIKGRIDSYTAPKIYQGLTALMDDGQYNLVIDMKDVSFISSAGILMFVNAQKQCKYQNRGEIVFSGIPDLIFSGFKMAGFDQYFNFYTDAVTAVGRF